MNRPRRSRPNPMLVTALMLGSFLCGGLAAFSIANFFGDDPVSYVLEQKALSVRYHLADLAPHAAEPEFLPTPSARSAAPIDNAAASLSSGPGGSTGQVGSGPSPSPAAAASSAAANPGAPVGPTPAGRVAQPSTMASTLLAPIQPSVSLQGIHHEFQGWNNCGPTTLGMYLSYFGRKDRQADIVAVVKPNPDDKNVRPDELAAYASRSGLHSLVRVNGTLEELKLLLSNGLPVMVETGYDRPPQGWMGHYRLLTGFDDKQFIMMDSDRGPNVKMAFSQLDSYWRQFNRLFLVIYPDDKLPMVDQALFGETDDNTMLAEAVERAQEESAANPKDAFAQFNLGTSLVGQKKYAAAAQAFDRARVLGLPWRMLWYQFGPYEAYLRLGRYDEVLALTDLNLKAENASEEAHYYKGLALRGLGRASEARKEFEAALFVNKNFSDARQALDTVKN